MVKSVGQSYTQDSLCLYSYIIIGSPSSLVIRNLLDSCVSLDRAISESISLNRSNRSFLLCEWINPLETSGSLESSHFYNKKSRLYKLTFFGGVVFEGLTPISSMSHPISVIGSCARGYNRASIPGGQRRHRHFSLDRS